MKLNHRKVSDLSMEKLEPKIVLSLIFSVGGEYGGVDSAMVDTMSHTDELHIGEHHSPGHGGGGPPGGGGGPAIDLPTVALHEFGHSLGLPHSTHATCGSTGQPIMCPYYIGEATNLHAEDISKIRALYPGGGSGTWANPNVTYSYMPDGARMDQGKNDLFATMNAAFGSEAVWKGIFADALNKWAAAEPALSFTLVSDNGDKFNANGASQGDPGFGDIRIGAHRFDGAGGTLAHAYFPPPNGATAAGDAHFDSTENWVQGAGLLGGGGGGGGGGGQLNVMPAVDLALSFANETDLANHVENHGVKHDIRFDSQFLPSQSPVLELSDFDRAFNETSTFDFDDIDIRETGFEYQSAMSVELQPSFVTNEF